MPAVNIKENKKECKIEFAIPGYEKREIHVNLEDDLVTISAEQPAEVEEEVDQFTRKEFSYNAFKRSFTLTQSSNSEGIAAKTKGKTLRLSVSKKAVNRNRIEKEIWSVYLS
jgi:HSP20 family protein